MTQPTSWAPEIRGVRVPEATLWPPRRGHEALGELHELRGEHTCVEEEIDGPHVAGVVLEQQLHLDLVGREQAAGKARVFRSRLSPEI